VNYRGQSEPYVSLAASRGPEGAVIVAEVNLGFIGDLLSKVRDGSTSVAYVVDDSGRLVAHPDRSLVLGSTDFSVLPQVRRVFAGNPPDSVLAGRARNLEGLPVLATSRSIEHLGWTVIAEQPLDDALRPVYASIATSIVLVALGLIAAVAASLLLARRMVRPIRQIEAGAREIAEGRLDRRIEVATGDELEALGAQFNRMAARLEEIYATQETRIAERTHDLALANEAKSHFLAAASHDLRQPVHALALFVGQLRATSMPPQAQALVARIERSVEALEELFEALLDLSKLDLGGVTPQPKAFPVQDLLSRLVADIAPVAEAKGLALTLVPTSLWVRSDPLLLERIMRNLIANAVRYTVEGRS
jgi:signal transduction histidine kinase